MSYVNTIKDLLRSDLKALIHHITGFEESSPEFERIEEKSWFTILNHNSVSITDDTVEKTIYEFVQKFLFHGFHIKAQNLKLLIDTYSKLPYFKKYSSPGVQWGLIDLLIKLSYKPTYALSDDLPLNIEKLKHVSDSEEDEIDWGTYLKEGLENFVLPESDEEKWSSESDDLEPKELSVVASQVVENTESVSEPGFSGLSLHEERKDPSLEELRRIEEHKIWLENNTQPAWWLNPDFREVPPSKCIHATWCFHWEKKMRKEGIEIEATRVLSEYKVLRELVCVFCLPPDPPGSFLIETSNEGYVAAKRTSTSSLSPIMFAEVLDNYVCPYLPYIRELNNFVDEMSVCNDNIPFTYYTYGLALKQILGRYRSKLKEIEDKIKAQKITYTMRGLLSDIRTWLQRLRYICIVHRKAICKNYTTEENWKCALRLLSVLYNEITSYENWKKVIMLGLFLRTFRTYLRILDNMFTNTPPDPRKEFIIFRSENDVLGIEIHEYTSFLSSLGGHCLELWNPFFELCLRALSSVHFLSQLDKTTSLPNRQGIYDLFYNGFMEEFKALVLKHNPEFKSTVPTVPETPDYMLPLKGKHLHSFKIPRKDITTMPLVKHRMYYQVEEAFDVYRIPEERKPKETLFDCFLNDLEQCDITFIPEYEFIKKNLFAAIEHNLKPKGFVADVVLKEYKLLDQLQYLWNIAFIQIGAMVPAILNKLSGVSTNPCSLCECMRESLADHIPPKIISRFTVLISDIPSSVLSNNILETIEYLSIEFQVKKQLRLIITEEMLLEYSQLFRFLLQLKFAYKTLHKLRFGVFDDNTGRAKRLFSLRIWLLHTVSAFNTYLSSLDEKEFLNKIKYLCEETKDLYTIQTAHKKFIKQCKLHCFFNNSTLRKLVLRLFKLSEILLQLWFLEEKRILVISKIENLERDYLDVMNSLALQIEMNFMRSSYFKYNLPFGMLHDEIMYNMPAAWD